MVRFQLLIDLWAKFSAIIEQIAGGDAYEQAKTPTESVMPPIPKIFSWSIPADAFHLTRVLCDDAGLSFTNKNIICACIFQESRFLIQAKNENLYNGKVVSTDWGICQVNDHYHIGPGKDFPSVQYVLDNPDKVVAWMISMSKHGLLKQWVSYSSGAFSKWLPLTSPMWDLHNT